MVPIHLCHIPSGSSSTQLIHLLQEIKHGFYGRLMKGAKVSKDFAVDRITVPLIFHYSTSDTIADVKDVERLIRKFTGSRDICAAKITKPFNHNDFIWGKNAPKLVFQPAIQFFEKHCKKSELSKETNLHY